MMKERRLLSMNAVINGQKFCPAKGTRILRGCIELSHSSFIYASKYRKKYIREKINKKEKNLAFK